MNDRRRRAAGLAQHGNEPMKFGEVQPNFISDCLIGDSADEALDEFGGLNGVVFGANEMFHIAPALGLRSRLREPWANSQFSIEKFDECSLGSGKEGVVIERRWIRNRLLGGLTAFGAVGEVHRMPASTVAAIQAAG